MIPVDGVSNFRDFGGLPISRGGRVATGRLYRCANPATITAAGMALLVDAGIRTVVDLRGEAERVKALAAFDPQRITVKPTPIEPKTSARLRELLACSAVTRAQVRDVMVDTYRGYAGEAATAFGAAIDAIVSTREGGVLIHCTAGKDRTGFVAAVLQDALGVSRDSIMDDYLETNRSWNRLSATGHLPLDSDAIEPVLVADPDYLAAAFDEIDRRDGDALTFILRATAGRVTHARLDAFLDRGQQS